ncbi:hypothetical protein EW146_g776 [Bondarzewia mesenterica]|uniref:Man(5)GlcNAc(2)-PP-dolichol translocation protein RFT1 n=1 Tax=Bondarzewia mesenterica TaxID=1095465 RepID=A0A4S4M5V6_9AGAM|nr:hypothetical protein EW146_g776 [Bondarzewia mesenterica]
MRQDTYLVLQEAVEVAVTSSSGNDRPKSRGRSTPIRVQGGLADPDFLRLANSNVHQAHTHGMHEEVPECAFCRVALSVGGDEEGRLRNARLCLARPPPTLLPHIHFRPQTFGTAAIQFELLLSTILFLSREGVRNALLRAPSSSSINVSDVLVTNISLLPPLLGIPFRLSVAIYPLAASIELLAEPLYTRAQIDLRFDVRVRAEGAAVFLKTFITFLVLVLSTPEYALAFAAGQAA